MNARLVKIDGILYTSNEVTQRKYTINDACSIALMCMNGKPICINSIRGRNHRDDDQKITLVELNSLVASIVDDSYYGY